MVVGSERIDIPAVSLFDVLEQAAARNPSQRATLFAGHEMTYGELFKATLAFMGSLQDAGVKAGDRVGIMLPNCPQYIIAYYATLGIGAVVVQINPMSPPPELEFLIEDSGLCLLVVYDKILPVVRATAGHTAAAFESVVVRFGSSDVALGPNEVWMDETLSRVTHPGQKGQIEPSETVAVLQYTGGTTGRPKGAMLTHSNLVANAYQMMTSYPGGTRVDDIMVCALPFFHVYAMTVCMNFAILVGMPMLIVPRFQPAELLELIRRYKPALFPAVPTMYVALTQALPAGSDDLKCLRVCNSGGAPMPKQVMQNFEHVSGAVVLEGYGLSESSPVTHFNPSLEGRKIGSIGLPVANTEVKVVDVGNPSIELGPNQEGELAIRGPQVMKGYWNRVEDTEKTIVSGWLLTGDIAVIDEDGFTFIVDRKKDLILASGYNVYPREVEEVLFKHPAVLEAAVVGVPDDYRGETVKAYVVVRPGHTVSAPELEAWCRGNLSAYKVPRVIEFRDELPKSAVGKVLRRALR